MRIISTFSADHFLKLRDDALRWSKRFLDLVGDATCYLHEVHMVE